MTPQRLWITGSQGLIGAYLLRQAPIFWPGCRAIPIARPDLDLTDFEAVTRRFDADRPDAVIHCAAISRSPVCEADPALAQLHNVEVTRHLASLCASVPLVFFSTDLVFDGLKGNYLESDPPRPVMVYARTKVEAEQQVGANPRHLVVRTSLNYGTSASGNRSFNEEMVNAWRVGKTLRLFTDEFRSPIGASETASAVLGLLSVGATGIVHVAGSERLSRWDIGERIAARHPEVHPRLEPSSLRDYVGPPRPPDVSLNCSRAAALLGRPLPGFRDWLAASAERSDAA